MASETENHGLTLPLKGEYEDSWGAVINGNFDEVDSKLVLRGKFDQRPEATGENRIYLSRNTDSIYFETDGDTSQSSWNHIGGRNLAGNDLYDSTIGATIWDASEGEINRDVLPTLSISLADSGSAKLSSGAISVSTPVEVDTSSHWGVWLSPPENCDVAASLESNGDYYAVHIEENTTSVGNPTVGWQLIKSEL